jgi:hypothetical protein
VAAFSSIGIRRFAVVSLFLRQRLTIRDVAISRPFGRLDAVALPPRQLLIAVFLWLWLRRHLNFLTFADL